MDRRSNRTQHTPIERWISETRFGRHPAGWAGDFRDEMIHLYQAVFPVTLTLERYTEINPRSGDFIHPTWLILRLPGQRALSRDMIRFEGTEMWSDNLLTGIHDRVMTISGAERYRYFHQIEVRWCGEDFLPDQGSRRPRETAVARYRRVYHRHAVFGHLEHLVGTLTYSPQPGLYLPPIEIDISV